MSLTKEELEKIIPKNGPPINEVSKQSLTNSFSFDPIEISNTGILLNVFLVVCFF